MGANSFFLGGGACDAWRSHVFSRGVRVHASTKISFLNGAIWCVLEHIFIIFLLSKSLKNIIFLGSLSKIKIYFWAILGALVLLFLHMGVFLLRFSHYGGLFTMWGPFCYFLLHGGGLFLGLPPPLLKFLRAPMIARRVQEHDPQKFFV